MIIPQVILLIQLIVFSLLIIVIYNSSYHDSLDDDNSFRKINFDLRKLFQLTFYFILINIFSHLIFFQSQILHINWIIAGFLIFLIFIFSIIYFVKSYSKLSYKLFIKKIFWTSLVFRLFSVLILYLVGYYFTGTEFEVGASDSKKYHLIASSMLDYFKSGSGAIIILPVEIDDYGFMYYNFFAYMLFGKSTIVIRIINCIFGSLSVVFAYKYLKLIIEDSFARIAGIIVMLHPIFLYFTGVHMKETILIFPLITTLYFSTIIIHKNNLNIKNILGMIISLLALFLLRFSIAIPALFTIFLIFLFSKKYNKGVFLFVSLGSLFLFALYTVGLIDQLFRIISRTGLYSSEQLAKSGSASNVGTIFFLFSGFLGPFPGLVDIPSPSFKIHSTTLYQIGGLFGLIFIKSFFIIGLLSIIKNKIKVFYPITAFYFINLLGLALSATALDIRYQTPNNLIIILISAVGVKFLSKKDQYIIVPYYIIVLVGTLLWNYIRLSGRGLI